MWIRQISLLIFGICAGAAVSGSTFAFVITLKIIPRLVGKTHTAKEVWWYETAVAMGGATGTLVSVYPVLEQIKAGWLLVIYGTGAGIFEGCVAVTLAEIMNVFPILFRRTGVKRGLRWVLLCFALGKGIGAYISLRYQI